jgi:hypothetical protein
LAADGPSGVVSKSDWRGGLRCVIAFMADLYLDSGATALAPA